MPPKTKSSAAKKPLKDPEGGLTAAGRAHFKETEGANLKPGVKGPADTPEKQKRKGSFLRRHFANPGAGPLQDDKGEPTRHALSAAAWGEPVPTGAADVKKLAKKGGELLEKFHESQDAKPKRQAPAASAKAKPADQPAGASSKAKPAARKEAAKSSAAAAPATAKSTGASSKAKKK